MVWPWTMARETPELSFYWDIFWPALIYAFQILRALILHLSRLSSVADCSGISQCADRQEEGQQNWTSNDQGQLHLRSLIFCSFSSAPLLTAPVFSVWVEGGCYGSGKYLCWFAKQMPVYTCGVKCWKDFMMKAAELCSARFLSNSTFNYILSSLNMNLPRTKRIWVSLVSHNNCKFWFLYLICVARFPSLKSIELL